MAEVAAFSILALTVGLSLGRPRLGRWRIHHAEAGVIGGLLVVFLGIGPPDVLLVAARILAFPVITIVSLMVITLTAERAGLFAVLAQGLARASHGSGRMLFALIFFTGTLVGQVFTNDAAVLIFTPLVFYLIEEIAGDQWRLENKLPFYFAVLYVANLVGALVIANPINIVVSSIFRIGFVEYARWMAFPALASIAISFLGLWFFFGQSVPRHFVPPASKSQTGRRWLQICCSFVLLLTLCGFFTETFTKIPTWTVALAGALAMLLVHALWGQGGFRPILRGVGWDVVIFLCGMFIVGLALRHVGLTREIGDLIHRIAGGDLSRMRLTSGVISAASSAVINNHPTADMMAWVIQGFSLPDLDKKMLAFAALVGGDLGPKMLPIGSLAALMWFRILRDKGVQIPYALYIRVGVPVTLAAVFVSVAALNLEAWLVRLLAP